MQRLAEWLFHQMARRVERIPPLARVICAVLAQIGIVVVANVFAFVLRFEAQIPDDYWRWAWKGMPLIAATYGLGILVFGIHRGLWRYVGFHDLKLILGAGIASTAVLYLVVHLGLGWVAYPRSVIVLTGILSVGFLGGIRVAVRVLREWATAVGLGMTRVVIVGAGNAGEMLARDLTRNPSYQYEPVAFVDDDPGKQGRTIHGIPVAGAIEEIPSVLRRYSAAELIVAIPSASPKVMQRVLAASASCHVTIKTLPNVKQILDSPVSMRQVRPMRLEDLLQREPVQTDLRGLHPLLEGRRVLVTGAGGSIGSELCRQVARYRPAQLVLLERYENSLHALELELRESFPQLELRAIVGDVTDAEGVKKTLTAFEPELLFHAAAHKHVPLMERNEREAVRNNVFGTKTLASAAMEAGVRRFVLISTDKAVNPTNVMGATKRVAEYLVLAMNGRGPTRFMAVRFGNVLGSNGSVVPLFAEQIRKGGPVTVTHPEMKRYFMTIPEAVQLILQATVLGQGGDLFVLDMGEQVRIVDLARNMILLSGLVPERDVKIVFTGLRPGEKLSEELLESEERTEPTSHVKINRVISRVPFEADELFRHLADLQTCLMDQDAGAIVRKLQVMVPTFTPSRSRAVGSSVTRHL